MAIVPAVLPSLFHKAEPDGVKPANQSAPLMFVNPRG
jgi:hypothetical protein